MSEAERVAEAVIPVEAESSDAIHGGIRALLSDSSAENRTRRLKLLLARTARGDSPEDVAVLEAVVQDDRAPAPVRDHAVALLLRRGFPDALRVTPEALDAFRARSTAIPVWPLLVLAPYACGEALGTVLYPRYSWGITAILAAHLSTWLAGIAGSLFARPFSAPRKWLRRLLRAVLWGHGALLLGCVLCAAAEAQVNFAPYTMAIAAGFLGPPLLAGISVLRRSLRAEEDLQAIRSVPIER